MQARTKKYQHIAVVAGLMLDIIEVLFAPKSGKVQDM